MSEHREKDKESKRQRALSRRAQLRRLHKALEENKAVLEVSLYRNNKLVEQIKDLERRLAETQKLVPFWVRHFP